jgi:hypothetical protein
MAARTPDGEPDDGLGRDGQVSRLEWSDCQELALQEEIAAAELAHEFGPWPEPHVPDDRPFELTWFERAPFLWRLRRWRCHRLERREGLR